MGFYTATISTDGSGDGTNLDATTGNPVWNAAFKGILMGILVDDNGAAATVDVTITEPSGLKRTILAVTDVTSDTNYNPQQEIQTNAGVATGLRSPYRLDSTNLKVTVAQGGTTVTAAIIVTLDIYEE